MHSRLAIIATAIASVSLASAPTHAADHSKGYKGQELAAEAKVTIGKARQIALEARKGKITDEELEHEAGGSGLRYTFDIRAGKIIYEIGVDAVTGDVLENKQDNGGD